MMFTLFKWLTWLCMPYTLIMLGLLLTALGLFGKRSWRAGFCVLMMTLLLVVIGLPGTARMLGHSLEYKYPPVELKDIPQADAIVVLGGGVDAIAEGRPYPELYGAGDRAVMGVRLWRNGKAPIIIPTGEIAEKAEKPLLLDMGVPETAIVCETEARDTAENASKTLSLLRARNCKKILLVTSAWHMPRAMMLFKAEGIEVIPVGCDYENTPYTFWSDAPLWMSLPGPESAARASYYIKEWLGILFYSLRTPPSK